MSYEQVTGIHQDFYHFRQDEERRKFFHLRDQSIKSSILIQGIKPKLQDKSRDKKLPDTGTAHV